MRKLITYQLPFLALILVVFAEKSIAQNIQFTEVEKEWIKNHPVIEFGYESNWPPFEIYENGEYKGIVGDYVKILKKETGIDIQPIANITWKETIEGLEKGTVDFTICAGITDERKKFLSFTDPYITSPMVILTRKDGKFIGGLEDLQGKKISLPKGYYTTEVIGKDYPKIQIVVKENIEEAIQSVSLGETEAFIGNLVVISYYIEHKGYSNLKIAAPTDYNKVNISLATRKDWPELISIANKIFDKMTFQEKNDILQKWVNVRYDHGVDVVLMWKIAIYSFTIIVILVGGVLLWNETLRKEIKNREKVEFELADTLKEISNQNNERKNLLNEIHHRLKNNLHMISGMLKLQALESGNIEVEKQLDEAVERIRSIALVHERIYKSQNDKNLNFENFVEPLLTEIINSFSIHSDVILEIDCNYELKNTNPLPSLALILNELSTNTLKYAFGKRKEEKKISIKILKTQKGVELIYLDNGKWIKNEKKSSLGISLIDIFSEQLGGIYNRNIENGTCYHFVFSDFYNDIV